MKALRKLMEARERFNQRYYAALGSLEESYLDFMEKYGEKATGVLDAAILTLYEGTLFLDNLATAKMMKSIGDEKNPIVRYLVENEGLVNGLSIHTGMEHLILASGIGVTYMVKEAVEKLEGVKLEVETKALIIYPALATMAYGNYFGGFKTWF